MPLFLRRAPSSASATRAARSGARFDRAAPPARRGRRAASAALALALATAALTVAHGRGAGATAAPDATPDADFPPTLHDTGLYAGGAGRQVREGIASFTPQYPLWSDGADKRRWLELPPGSSIDGARPDAWEFPVGTKLWKEFAHAGRPIETRYIERRADGSWRFATYVWNEQGTQAALAPAAGAVLAVPAAPDGRYVVPRRDDCMACHGSTAVPVLGLGALQLSPDRDPLAAGATPPRPGDVDLRALVARGWLRNFPQGLLDRPPRIAADTPVERAALGYLHGNCAHCHNATRERAPVRLNLAQSVANPQGSRDDVLRSSLGAASRYRPPDAPDDAKVVVPGDAHASMLVVRMQSRSPRTRMPPLGTDIPDPEGLALVHRWITQDLPTSKETRP